MVALLVAGLLVLLNGAATRALFSAAVTHAICRCPGDAGARPSGSVPALWDTESQDDDAPDEDDYPDPDLGAPIIIDCDSDIRVLAA